MRAVIVSPPAPPKLASFPVPESERGHDVIAVRAAALTNLDVANALGHHYLTPQQRPFVVGREAVGISPDGQRLWFNATSLVSPYGAMAEYTLAKVGCGIPVPADISDTIAAAIGNAGLAAWLPLSWRARLRPGETVMILGATGVTGGIAVSAAKHLGAGCIVAAGRRLEALEQLRDVGADVLVRLDDPDLADAVRRAAPDGVDVVLDYLGGAVAEAALAVMNTHGRMVQIGSMLAPGIHLPAQLARRRSLDILGFAYYHAPLDLQIEAYAALCKLLLAGTIRLATMAYGLDDFGHAWSDVKEGSGTRPVIMP